MSSGQPYSTTAQVLNQALTKAVAQAGWSVTEGTGDVAARIQEGDTEIDARLAAMGYTIPFTYLSANPPMLLSLSVLYARYAVLRDLYSGNSPSVDPVLKEADYKDRFEEQMQKLEDGWLVLLDASGNVISRSKYDVKAVQEEDFSFSAKPSDANNPFTYPQNFSSAGDNTDVSNENDAE